MLSSRAICPSYFYSFICFFDMVLSPQTNPVFLCLTSSTYPNCPFPIFLPTWKSDFKIFSGSPNGVVEKFLLIYELSVVET